MWAVYQSAIEDHVTPIDDWREHELSQRCRCVPMACPWQTKTIWVHHSWDGREIGEGARLEAFSGAGMN